jgi:hypothetical protein
MAFPRSVIGCDSSRGLPEGRLKSPERRRKWPPDRVVGWRARISERSQVYLRNEVLLRFVGNSSTPVVRIEKINTTSRLRDRGDRVLVDSSELNSPMTPFEAYD